MRFFSSSLPKPLQATVRACRPHFASAALFSALINILYLAPTIYMMQVYDRVVPTGGLLTLFWITVVVAVALATLAALDAVRARLIMRASLRINRILAADILGRLMSRPSVKDDEPSTTQAMRDFDTLRGAIGGQAMIAALDLPWMPIFLLVAFLIHPLLGFLVLAGGGLLIVLALVNEHATKAVAQKSHAATARAYAGQEAIIRRSEVVRALGMGSALVERQVRERRTGLEAAAEAQSASARFHSIVKFCRMFMQSLALGAGAWLAVAGEISVGAIIAASVLLSRALQPIEQLVGAWSTVSQARLALGTLTRLFEGADTSDQRRTALPDPAGHLEFDRVVVRTPEGAILLRNVSFGVGPGEVLGIIGPSGAGKSTLARVAATAVAPSLGEVRIDGARADDWDAERLALGIGYLPQESALLPGTIAENISRFAIDRGMPAAMVDLEVVAAARLAGVHNMILAMPQGYDTSVSQEDHRLSAGQAQRIALARALFGTPPILVLDEPNSALDADGEEALMRAIKACKERGAAILIVAHRTSVLASADRLLVLGDGMVSALGPRKDVLAELQGVARAANVVAIKERALS